MLCSPVILGILITSKPYIYVKMKMSVQEQIQKDISLTKYSEFFNKKYWTVLSETEIFLIDFFFSNKIGLFCQ